MLFNNGFKGGENLFYRLDEFWFMGVTRFYLVKYFLDVGVHGLSSILMFRELDSGAVKGASSYHAYHKSVALICQYQLHTLCVKFCLEATKTEKRVKKVKKNPGFLGCGMGA